MHRCLTACCGREQGIVYQSVGKPLCSTYTLSAVRVVSGGNVTGGFYPWAECSGLLKGLRIVLIYPLLRAVGRYDYKGSLTVKCFGYSRSVVEQGSTGGSYHCHRGRGHCRYTESHKSGRAFINHGMKTQAAFTCKSHNDRRIARAG